MKRVAIVTQFVPQYRIPFWEALRSQLAKEEVELDLFHGKAHRSFAKRNDIGHLEWANALPMREWQIGSKELVYMPALNAVKQHHLVISNQEIRLLHNFSLLLAHLNGGPSLALMGHGMDSRKRGQWCLSEAVKRAMSRRVHWWFAYNHASARVVESFGYPETRITSFMNTVDTDALISADCAMPEETVDSLRASLGLENGPVGLFLGALAPIKDIPFVLESCHVIRSQVANFQAVFVGDGPERDKVLAASEQAPWIHWVPPQFNQAKVPYLRLADILLMPIGLGLGILDAFALGRPLVTLDAPGHGPEVDYLEHDVNGWMLGGPRTPAAYGEACAAILLNPELRKRLARGAKEAGSRFRLSASVDRFAHGIHAALEAPRYRG